MMKQSKCFGKMHTDFWGYNMSFKEIKSADNALVKKITKLKNKKYREEFGEFMAEGHLSLSAGLSSCYELCFAVSSQSFAKDNKKLLDEIKEVVVLPDRIFNQVADAVTPQGVMGIFKIPENIFDVKKVGKTLIYCDNLRDPGNAGTIIRTADALGIDGVIFSKGCADIYAPKLVRSTMGSLFHTNIYKECDICDLENLRNEGYSVVSSALADESISLYDYKFPEKSVVIIGNEAHGVSQEVISISDACVKIPMYGFAESLNASVAAAIIMSEVSRGKHNEK